jgi:OOP family OmpA-OmpF porin
VLRYTVLLLSLLVTACNSSLVQLQKTEPVGTPYQMYLAREYLDFAEAEADQYDWFDSGHFSRKGLKLARGEDVKPEIIHFWDIDKDNAPTLLQAREYLTQTLTDQVKESHPKEAARAQFLFDCWVEQQEEIWQTSHIAYCREKFYNTLDKLAALSAGDMMKTAQAVPAELPAKQQMAEAPVDINSYPVDNDAQIAEPVAQPIPMGGPEVYSFAGAMERDGSEVCDEKCIRMIEKRTVYFELASDDLTKRTQRVVSNIIAQLKNTKKYEITLNGYADRLGKEEYNMGLSKGRAQSIKEQLVAAGLDPNAITVFAFGEFDGLLDTPDEVAEKENRAVEIIIET